MLSKHVLFGVVSGSTLIALLLSGSSPVGANSNLLPLPPGLVKEYDQGRALLSQGSYFAARDRFLRASALAQRTGLARQAAMNLSNAGFCLQASLKFSRAQQDFERAREMARGARDLTALAAAQNNLANLYIHMGEFEKALGVANEALAGPEGHADAATHGKLLFQRADSLAEMNRFDEAEPVYRQAIEELTDLNDFDAAARIHGKFGVEYLKLGRLDEAESELVRGLWLVRIHRLNASANILAGLAELESKRGNNRAATALFKSAIEAPPNLSPAWLIRSRRGGFRLENGDLAGAWDDYREARAVALEMRADMVPADQDRVALESGLSSVVEGVVDSGNRLARGTGNHQVLRETFEAAEQDRMWSLRALVPSPNDWRSHLPDHYWELLARYQAMERTAVAARSPEAARRIETLKAELQRIEAASSGETQAPAGEQVSALEHAQSVMDGDTVLFSFLITKQRGWVWAVDRTHVDVYPLAAPDRIQRDASAFRKAVQSGTTDLALARQVYCDLFGAVPQPWLRHRRWLIEPDGTLHDLPFAALVPDDVPETNRSRPLFLVERAALALVPGALLMKQGSIRAEAPFVGIGDPIYNGADARYAARNSKPGLTLPRLPNTSDEIAASARAWGSAAPVLLTGADATLAKVEPALRRDAPIVHFATHVITAPGEFRSGMIALSLDSSGAMGLLGPKQIVARPMDAGLIVMNGCHSAQGETLPGAGLMGLTRAWIGAGANAVIATGWDVPDAAAQSLMTDFYSALRSSPEDGTARALRTAQIKAVERGESEARWAAYSLLSRIP